MVSSSELATMLPLCSERRTEIRRCLVRTPEEFVPNRPERLPHGRGYGFAFGAGSHTCIGRRLAVGGAVSDDRPTDGVVTTITAALFAAGLRPRPGP